MTPWDAAELAALREQGQLLVAAAEQAGLGAPVPTCPGWDVADLLRHVGLVHRWAIAVVEAAGPAVDQDEFDRGVELPPDFELAHWVLAGLDDLVRLLAGLAEDYTCWALFPHPEPRAMWIRRQLHETAVHRMDAELAAHLPLTPVATAVAADGIDELLAMIATEDQTLPEQTAAMAVVPDDTTSAWSIQLDQDGSRFARAAGPAGCTLRGSADDLYAYLWNRCDSGVAVQGDPGPAATWRAYVRISR